MIFLDRNIYPHNTKERVSFYNFKFVIYKKKSFKIWSLGLEPKLTKGHCLHRSLLVEPFKNFYL